MSLDPQVPIEGHRALRDSWDELDDDLAADQDAGFDEIDATLADRMLRRVLRERRLYEADAAVAQAQKDQVDAWLQKRREAHDTAYLEGCLRQYHEARLAVDAKARTLHLPSGTLAARKKPDAWEFDEEAFIAWAEVNRPDLLRTKLSIDRPVVKQTLVVRDDGRCIDHESGEYVPAVTVEPGGVSFTVKAEDVA